MKYTSTPRILKNYLCLLVSILAITLFNTRSYAQTKNYALVTPSTGIASYNIGSETPNSNPGNVASIDNPGNAILQPPGAPATLNARYFSLLGLGYEGEAYIQLKYGSPLAAGKTTYIGFDQPTNNGLNLDLLGIVGDLTGLFTRKIVQIDAYNGATASSDGTIVPAANVSATVVTDAAGKTYFAVTSAAAYNSVRIRLRVRSNALSISLGSSINMNVYPAFNYSADNCGTSIFTSVAATGLNVSLTSLVTNPQNAIDGNINTSSQLQAGLVTLGSSVSQTIYLNGLSGSGDVAKVILSQGGSLLTVNVLKTITVQAFNGNTAIGTPISISNLINLDLLGLFSNNRPFPVFFTPGVPFDRIRVSLDNGLAIGGNILAGGLNINEAQRTVPKPLFTNITGNAQTLCGGSTLTLAPQSPNATYTYNFYKKIGANGTKTAITGVTGNTVSETGLTAGVYTYYVAAQLTGCTAESDMDSVVVTVNPTLLFTATPLSNGTVGKVYSKQLNPATSGTPAYTYALAAGSTLPAGLTLTPAGLISGTPTTAVAAGTFGVVATDAGGCTATATHTLTITGTLTLPGGTLPNGTVNKVYPSTTLPAPSGGSTPYTYTATNLPPGVILNPATGVLTGTPTTAGTYPIPVTIADADGNTATTTYTIIVRSPLVLTASVLSDGTTGTPYPAQVIPAATGGSGVNTYVATNLPPGLSFNPATRAITGTPTQTGTFTFPVTVTDDEGNTTTLNYTIVVKDPLALANVVLPDGAVNVVYPAQVIPAATGGTGPYTYIGTNLPPGLIFDPVTRTISGTPTQSGTFTLSIKVTDSGNGTITVPYTLKVAGALTLPTATLANGKVGTAYTSPALPAVSGGTGPYTYSAINLPPGLSFNAATRVISGNPTSGGNYTVTMKVTDNAGNSTSTDYALNITVDAPSIAGMTICSGNTATLVIDNSQANTTYNFYSSTGNTPIASGTTFTTPALTVTTTYYAEAVSGTAVSARVPVTVTVNPVPDLPVVAINNVTISAGQTATLQASAASGSTIKWYGAATGGIELGSGVSFTTPALSANTTYYAGTTNSSGCMSLTRIPVTVTVINGTVNPNCYAATKQESGITGGLLCVACTIQNPGYSTDADLTNFTRISLPVGIGTTGYQRLIFQNPGAATDSISVDLETPTGLLDLTALGGITVSVMNGTTVVSSYPLNGNLLGLRLITGNRFTATVAAGGVYDRVEVKVNALLTALTNLNIYGANVIAPNPTINAGNQSICSGSTATLKVTPVTGTTITWYSAATGGTILSANTTFTTPVLTATTIYYIEVSKAGCANPTRVPVTVTVTTALAPPVLAAVVPVCSGSPATLSVDSPVAGVTYNWFTAATGGTSVFTGTVFTTPALTANTTYYLEASNGSCVSATRTAANITINPRPATPQITASATTVNQGESAILTGSSTETNVTFNWYTSQNAVTPVFTGAVYVTPPLTATTTFYLDAVSTVTGCASSVRVQQTITVNPTGTPVPVGCEGPVSETHGVGGLISLLARVDNPALAIDGDQVTASTLSIPVGIGSNVFQQVNFAGLSNVGDTVRVLLTSPAQVLSLALLPSVTVTTYKGTVSNNDGVAVNNPLINLQLLSGGSQALLTFVPAAQFDGVEVKLNSGLLGALTAINFNYAKRTAVAPVVASANVTACLNATATLSVPAPQPGIIYKWYDASGNYLGNDGATFTTPAITADTKFFVEASRGGCGSSRTQVNVTVTPAPAVPQLLSPTENTCVGSGVSLKVQNPQAGVTYNWYKAGVLNPVQKGAVFNDVVTANVIYAVEAVNACGVVSAQATVSIVVGSLTPPVLTPPAVTINSGEKASLVANSSTTGLTYSWYLVDPATPGATPISTLTNGANGTFITDPLTATTTFYVTAQGALGTCISGTASVVVTVNTVTPNPGSVPCEAAVTETHTAGGSALLPSVANPGFAIDDDINTSSSLFIPIGLGAASVQQTVGFTGSSVIGDQVKLGLTQTGALLTLGVANSISVTTYNNGISNNDETFISDPALNLNIGTGNKDATVQFTPAKVFDAVQLKLNSGLVGLLTSINLNYAQRIIASPTVVSANVSACEGSSATLAVSNPVAGLTYNWYDSANPTAIVAANTATYTTPANLVAGTHVYFVKANRNGCASPVGTNVTVTINGSAPAPVPATGNPVTTCLNTPVTLSVDQVAGVSYNWYTSLTGGTPVASNTNSFTTPATLTTGTTDYYVEAVNGNSCVSTSARTKISITINPPATAGDITVSGAANPFCAGTSAVLTATSALPNPVFTWYSDAALTNAVFTGPTFNIASVTATTTYYVTVKADNRCANEPGTANVVTLTVNPPASSADITISGIPASLCAGTPVILTASTTTVTNPVFTWYKEAALINVVYTGAVFNTPGSTVTTQYYVTVSGSNKCANSADAKVVTLTINPPATAADISVNGVPAVVCAGSGTSLTASSLTVNNPVFTWYSDAALTNAVFTGAVFSTPVLTANTTYYVTVQGLNKCPNVAGTASVVVLNVNPQLSFTGTALSNGSTVNPYSVQLNPATGGTPAYSYALAAGSNLPAGLSLSPSGLISGTPTAAGNYTFSIIVTDSKGCSAVGMFTLNIGTSSVLSLPAATLPDGIVGTIYTVQTLPAAIGGSAPYTYSLTGLPAGLNFDPATRNISGTPAIGGLFTATMTVTDGNNSTASANYQLRVIVPAPVVADGSNCGGSSATLTVSNVITGVTYNWYNQASGGASIFTGTVFQTPVITANTTYYVEGVAGVSSIRVAVNVSLKSPASAADVSVAGIPSVVCGGSTATLTASSATVSNPTFNWYTDAALTNRVYTGAVFTTPVLTANTTYYLTVQGPGTCESSAATAKVVALNVNPQLNFAGGALTNGSTISPYNTQLNAATGGTAPYTYALASGSTLPAGLILSNSGLISGLPLATGNYTFSITATDSKGCSATAQFTLNIGAIAVLVLPPAILPDGQVGTVYPVQTLPAVIGGTAPYTYTAIGVPPGLNFNPADRTISGTPTLGGTFTVIVTVTDANGSTATGNYPVTVTVPAPVVADGSSCGGSRVTLTVSNPIAGVTYNWYTSAIGGAPIFTGTSFQTPAITASTTYYAEGFAGTTSNRVAVNVNIGTPATAADISVAGVPSVVCAGSGVILTASSATVTSPVFKWYTDPALTSLVFTGAVYNIPAVTANITYYVTVQGPNTCESSPATAKVVTLTVNPALVFNGAALAGASTTTTYSAQIGSATGGTPGYTYSVASGSTLPAGLTLSPAGQLTGTPAATGNYTFSIVATDSKGCNATAVFTLAVGSGTQISLPPATLPNGQVGTAYVPQTLPAVIGGTAPFTYVANNLPPGLRFDPATRTISGTPTLGGTFTVTVTVTDGNGLTAANDYVVVVNVPASAVGDAVSCGGTPVTLTVTNVIAGVTYNWYSTPTGGAILFTGPAFQTPAITATTIYYVEAISGTATSGRIPVNVTVATALASPVVTVKSSTLSSITFGWNDVPGATAYEVSTDGGTTWVNPSSGAAGTTHLITGLQANTMVKLMVRAKGNTSCQTSAAGSVTGTATDGLVPNDVFIPNTFTPNGDGRNDIFYVYGTGISKLKLQVYNQWGQFIFESLQQQVGWDGSYRGQIQPNGVYVYYVELVMTDGSTVKRKGTITILR
ncbi:gliding motility-associated-like protein [Pedobacter cryoconitis]|uniref:Gliding motility-associated-like protein n=1 Tax=Pedobacter cryoconitis TaxID=188932 RepID=A0A7W9DYQ2_9SPHI|nr:putative Ig domain-containing protein [Pedobacter cryoconitis]MBB5636472.1 gliding motility-associated-like protein [Pedobacter cryoconitis]